MQVAVVVKIPIPPRIDRSRLEAGMAKSVPEFQALPGLVRKYYTISDDQKFGGIYLWSSRQAAEAHFNHDWRARMAKLYGFSAETTYFDVPILIEGPELGKLTFGVRAADGAASTLVAVVVKIPIPPKIDRAKLEAGMAKSVPEFQALPGLVRKYYTISDDEEFGGIYLWASRQAAEAHFSDDWRAKMMKSYRAPAEVAYFSVPIVVDGLAAQK